MIDPTRNNANAINGVREDDVRRAHAPAIFSQNRFHLTDRWTATPGVRVESCTQKRNVAAWQQLGASSCKTDNTGVVPGIGTTWKIEPDVTLYGAVRNPFDRKYIASRVPEGIFPGIDRLMEPGVEARF